MKFYTLFCLLNFLFVIDLSSQVIAPDFNVTDISGETHHLYDILEEGKVVIVDVSATWCSPCWAFHSKHYLKDINDKYGPNGTNQVRVLFYEGDSTTGQDKLEGGAGSMGNWLTGVDYPIINEDVISLDLNIWAPEGFPTINVVRPSDKAIIADLYYQWNDGTGLPAMEEIIEAAFPTASKEPLSIGISVLPNPTSNALQIDFSKSTAIISSLEIIDFTGRKLLISSVDSSQKFSQDISNLNAGIYYIQLKNDNKLVGVSKFVKI